METTLKSEANYFAWRETPEKTKQTPGTLVLTDQRVLFAPSGKSAGAVLAGAMLSGPLTYGIMFKALTEVKPQDVEAALQRQGGLSILYSNISEVKQEGTVKTIVITTNSREVYKIQTGGGGLFGKRAFESLQPWIDIINQHLEGGKARGDRE